MSSLIVFDLDGTLADTRGDLSNAVNFMRQSMGLDALPQEVVVSMVGDGIPALVSRALAVSGIADDTGKALRTMKEYYHSHLLESTFLYPGVGGGIAGLKNRGNVIALVSNKTTDACIEILRGLGVADFFDDIIGGDSSFPLKPAPDALDFLQHKYQIPREKCWILGDNHTDISAGKHAGFHTVFAEYGFGVIKDDIPEFSAAGFDDFLSIICRKQI